MKKLMYSKININPTLTCLLTANFLAYFIYFNYSTGKQWSVWISCLTILAIANSRFTKKIQQDATVHQNFISYLYEAQHLSGDTPLDADSVQQLHVQQPSTYAKPEAASAVLGSWWWAVLPETCWTSYKYEIKILINCCILLDLLFELEPGLQTYYNAETISHKQWRSIRRNLDGGFPCKSP